MIQEYTDRVRTSLPTLYGTNPQISVRNIAHWICRITNNTRFKLVPDDVRNREYYHALTIIWADGYPKKFINRLIRIKKKELFLVLAKDDSEDMGTRTDDMINTDLLTGIQRHTFCLRLLDDLVSYNPPFAENVNA